MSRPVKYCLWLGSSLLILTLFFAFGLPEILRAVLTSQLAKNLHRPAAVQSVSFNPFKLCLTINGLSIREPDNATVFVSFDQLMVNAEILSIFEGGVDLCEVTLVKPYARIIRTEANQYNFSDLASSEEKKPEDKESKPLLFSVANIRLTDGAVEFDDLPKKVVHRVTDIQIGLPLISNFKQLVDVFVQPSFSAKVNGNPFSLSGQTKPFADSLETTLDINVDDLSLTKFLPYVPAQLNFKIPSGRLSTNLKLLYIQAANKAANIKIGGKLNLAELAVVGLDNAPVLSLPSLGVSGIDCSVNNRELVVDDIALKGLNVALAREKDGSISLQKLVRSDNETGSKKEPEQKTAASPAWSVVVKKFTFIEGAVSFDDRLPLQPTRFNMDNFNFTIANIATAKDSKAELDLGCRINTEGTLSLKGAFTINPLTANLSIDLAGLDMRFAQSYIPDTLLIALTSGTLSLKGDVDFKQVENSAPAIVWQGDIRLANWATTRKGDKEDLLKFASLELQSMRTVVSPLSLDIKAIKFTKLFMRPTIEADGTVNLTSLSAPQAAPPQQPPRAEKKEPLPPVNIGSIILEKSRMQFTDKSIKPRYKAELADINGRITGLSTKADSQATIRLNAKLNRYAPFLVTGTVSPLREKLTADVKVNFNNIDLSPFSPYSGKFIGRMIEKGRLSLELTYTIKDNQLTSQNKVFIDQFTLGKNVESKDATSLPVGLAISLLKDRKGEIHLDLPVSGSLDDPSFKVGKVVLQMLVNLLEKAATSPFALVGALIPGGADISNIPFVCGTAELDGEAKKRLDIIAGLLAEKPDLSLEIQAVADDNADIEGLRQEMVMRKLRVLKFNDLSKKEREGLTPEKVVIPADEYEDFLWQAYKSEKFEKPKGVLGLQKRLAPDEMKKAMAEHSKVTDEDMKELLQQRGLTVKQYLTEDAKVPAEKLFIIDSRLDSGKGPTGCAVEFKLK